MRSHENDPGPVSEKARSKPSRSEDDGSALAALTAGKSEAAHPSGVLGIQAAAGNASVSRLLDEGEGIDGSSVHEVIGSGGAPLDNDTRSTMEDKIGADFSGVRVHTDSKASESAKAVQAHAYTVGNDVVFQEGQYSPGTESGQKMLAHELTHVVQQQSGPVDGTPAPGGVSVSNPSDRYEKEAEATADAVMSGQAPSIGASAGGGVQRAAQEDELQMSSVQRAAEEDELQTSAVQRAAPDEELQMSSVQRAAEEDELQTSAVQRAAEEDELQTSAVQRAAEEDELQTSAVQRAAEEDELQMSSVQREDAIEKHDENENKGAEADSNENMEADSNDNLEAGSNDNTEELQAYSIQRHADEEPLQAMSVQRASVSDRLKSVEQDVEYMGKAVGELQDEGLDRGAKLPGADPDTVTYNMGGGETKSHQMAGGLYQGSNPKYGDPQGWSEGRYPGSPGAQRDKDETVQESAVQRTVVQREISTGEYIEKHESLLVQHMNKLSDHDRKLATNQDTINHHSGEINELQDAARAKGHNIRPKPETRTTEAPA